MKCITKDLAKQMEGCFKQIHIEVTKQYKEGTLLELSGGAACFSEFNSYLSQVVGWGFATSPNQFKSELEHFERFYKAQNHARVDIELCPFVGNELAVFLSKRGYKITELNTVSALDLKTYIPLDSEINPLEIKKVTCAEAEEWASQMAIGFGYTAAKNQFFHYVHAKGVNAFAVYDQESIVAGGVVAVHDKFCDLGLSSTHLGYRGRGLHKKLLAARLNFAKKQDLSWAMVTTKPGTVSDVNVQKMGFQCAYTRIKMTLALKSEVY